MKVGHILRLWNLILTSSVEPKMKPAVSLSNTPFISITEERQEAQKHQMKWVSCAVSDAWELCRNSELPSCLMSESPQLSTFTLDLLTELCLAFFKIKKKVPLFKQFFYCWVAMGKRPIASKIKMNLQIFITFFPHKVSVTKFLMLPYFLCGERSDTVLQQVPTSHSLSVCRQATLSFCALDWSRLTYTLKSAKPFTVKFPSTVPTFLRWTLFFNK